MNRTALKLILFLSVVFLFPLLLTRGIAGNFGDIYQYAAPFRHFAKTSLQTGVIPLWNPYIFSGTPFLASPQSSLFYPLTHFFYFFPLNYAFNLFIVLHIFLNFLGMYLLLQFLNTSRSASLFGGTIWSFSFFFLSKIAAGHVIHLSGYSWTPYFILFTFRAVTSFKSQPALIFLSVLLSSSLQFFSGHIQVWVVTQIFFLLLLVWKFAVLKNEERISSVKFSIAYLLSFIILTSIQLLPTLIYIFHSTRSGMAEILGEQSLFAFATSYSMTWKALIHFILPDFFGNPMAKTFVDPEHPSVYFETYTVYFGIIPFIFSIAGSILMIKKRKTFLPVLCLLFLLLSMGKNFILYRWIWKAFEFQRVPARFFLLSLFALVLSASFFWNRFLKEKKTFLKISVFFVIFLDLFLNGRKFIWTEDHLSKIGKSSAFNWMQSQTLPSFPFPLRIFTKGDIDNPNKTMFFQISNVNGFEAILQKSLFNYFIHTQKNPHITTTGVDVTDPGNHASKLFSAGYLLTTEPMRINWPLKFQAGILKCFENPKILPPVQNIRTLKIFQNPDRLFAFINSPLFDPVNCMATLNDSGNEKEFTLDKKEHQLLHFKRQNSNRIKMKWKSNEQNKFWIFLSESHYPGWEAWSESGLRFKSFQANGYFQGILFDQTKTPSENLFWIFNPLDFRIGVLLSSFFIVFLVLFGIYHTNKSQIFQDSDLGASLSAGEAGELGNT